MTLQMSLVLAELQCFEHPNNHPAKLGSKQKIKNIEMTYKASLIHVHEHDCIATNPKLS